MHSKGLDLDLNDSSQKLHGDSSFEKPNNDGGDSSFARSNDYDDFGLASEVKNLNKEALEEGKDDLLVL